MLKLLHSASIEHSTSKDVMHALERTARAIVSPSVLQILAHALSPENLYIFKMTGYITNGKTLVLNPTAQQIQVLLNLTVKTHWRCHYL